MLTFLIICSSIYDHIDARVAHGGKYCNVLKQATVKQFIVLFPIFKRELVKALYILSLLYIPSHVCACVKVIMLQGIIELRSPKSFRSQLDLSNIIRF